MCILEVNKRKFCFFLFMLLSYYALFNLYSDQVVYSHTFPENKFISLNVKTVDNHTANTINFRPDYNCPIEVDSLLDSYLNLELLYLSNIDLGYVNKKFTCLALKNYNFENSDGENAFFIKRLLE
jgi:hypothetical protein